MIPTSRPSRWGTDTGSSRCTSYSPSICGAAGFTSPESRRTLMRLGFARSGARSPLRWMASSARAALRALLNDAGTKFVRLPARSPNFNRMIFLGETASSRGSIVGCVAARDAIRRGARSEATATEWCLPHDGADKLSQPPPSPLGPTLTHVEGPAGRPPPKYLDHTVALALAQHPSQVSRCRC